MSPFLSVIFLLGLFRSDLLQADFWNMKVVMDLSSCKKVGLDEKQTKRTIRKQIAGVFPAP